MARTHSPEPNRYGFGTLRQGGMDGKKEERKGRVVSFEEDRSYKCVNGGDNVWGKYENGDDDDKDSIRSKAKIENFPEFPRFGTKVNDGFLSSKSEKIKERLQQSIRDEVKEKIANILHEVEQLSDVEKLLLYLQLPTGIPVDDVLKQKSHNNPLGKKADIEVFQTCTWIQTHLMEDPNVSLPKQEVYEEYKSFCSSNNLEPLCAADFGKVMKQVFPSVKPRRLGTRGNSRYCYSGLTKNLTVKLPVLPNICSKKETCNVETKDSSDDDMHTAACQLVLEWAEKLLEEKFTALTDLAWYLVESLCVDSRSVAAFTLLFLSNIDEPRKGNQAANFLKQVCGNRKRETQIHLQRKLQEKELIKEQKKKVQEQRQIAKSVLNKTGASRKCQRTLGKKASLASQPLATEKLTSTKELCVSPVLEDKNLQSKKIDNDNVETVDEGGKLLHSLQTEKLTQVELSNNIEQGCDETEMKQKIEKVPIPRKSTRTSAVCISPGMSGIIAVSPVQITLLGTQTSPKPNKFEKKYKRIQPKSNASKITSKSSTVLPPHNKKSHKKQANETSMQKARKTSNLWNHAEKLNSEQSPEESNGTKVTPSVVNNCAVSIVTEKPHFEVDSLEAVYPVICSNSGHNNLNLNGNLNFDNSNDLGATTEVKNTDVSVKELSNSDFALDREELYSNFIPSDAPNVEDAIPITVKRHCEDPNPDATASKKPLLENIFKNAIPCLPTWEIKENVVKLEQTDKLLAETLMHAVNVTDKQTASNCEQEEVSIYKLETDALIEYFQDLSAESNPVLNERLDENLCDKHVQQQTVQNSNNQKQQPTNTAAQLSQLRMLLERNLPKPTNKNAVVRNLKNQSGHLEAEDLPGISSVMTLHNDCFDLKSQQENENKLSELNQIVLRETGGIVSKVCNSNYDEKLTDVCWTDPGDENITLQKNNGLEETHLVENMSDDQVLSHIQNSMLSGENSDDIDVRNSVTQQPTVITSNNNISNLSSFSDTDVHQLHNLCETKCISTYTQIPSVPPSPNARRRAFNFLPISPRQTPILESVPSGNTIIASPIPSQFTAASNVHSNTVSVAVGSSRPTSAASSPFVSPRSTPVPLSRSRHNSGQSLYSTSRQTPLQNFDSGVSSISTSPFISPQPTPLPVSRLRHNSSHSQNRTVTFNATSSPHTMYSQSIFTGSRSRHNSGPGIPHQLGQTMSPRSAPLSPMVSECHTQSHFSFPCVGDTPTLRSRHNSASSVAPLSPVSEQVSPPSNNEVQIGNDHLVSCEPSLTSQYSLNLGKSQELESPAGTVESSSGDMQYQQLKSLLNSKILLPHSPSSKHQQPAKSATVQSELKQQWLNNRQRHASGPLLFQRSNYVADQSSQEIQLLLQNASFADPYTSSNRSQSVPPYQMLQNLISQCSPVVHEDNVVSKSHPTTPVISNSFTFSPSKVTSGSSTVMETSSFVSPPLASDAMFSTHVTDPDEILVNGNQPQAWESLNREINGVPISARRNITDILGQPREDLEVTLDDLRDLETDFSKLAQELEDMNRNDESDLP